MNRESSVIIFNSFMLKNCYILSMSSLAEILSMQIMKTDWGETIIQCNSRIVKINFKKYQTFFFFQVSAVVNNWYHRIIKYNHW